MHLFCTQIEAITNLIGSVSDERQSELTEIPRSDEMLEMIYFILMIVEEVNTHQWIDAQNIRTRKRASHCVAGISRAHSTVGMLIEV